MLPSPRCAIKRLSSFGIAVFLEKKYLVIGRIRIRVF